MVSCGGTRVRKSFTPHECTCRLLWKPTIPTATPEPGAIREKALDTSWSLMMVISPLDLKSCMTLLPLSVKDV
eukprot:37838-Eustigmatos_ZCMA.PRE.1